MKIAIREAGISDSYELMVLAGQLGYSVSEEQVRNGILRIAGSDTEKILVAADEKNEAVAWTSVAIVEHFYTPPVVEISGFVVDEKLRGRGIGNRLMSEAEAWARDRGHSLIRLRANATRKDAHRFYEGLGFEKTKEQFMYVKKLGGESP